MVIGFDESHLYVRDGGQIEYDGVVILREMTLTHQYCLYFITIFIN